MFIQIEITTVCNFSCFYCAGRDMPQRNMAISAFDALLRKLPQGRHVVSLQGEGEPVAHPRFFEMAAKVWRAGHRPYLITNCSLPRTRLLPKVIPMIAVSLDTMDPAEADRIGRKRLDRVVANFEALLTTAGPRRIVVHTVDYGQDRRPLEAYLRRCGIGRHIVQPLQVKEDYRQRYPERVVAPAMPAAPAPCAYLVYPKMRFFNIDGLEMPCSYIKDAAQYESADALRGDFSCGRVPAVCTGCRELGSGMR